MVVKAVLQIQGARLVFSLLFALSIVVLGVCIINISSLNLTENEEKLLYVLEEEEVNTEGNKTEVNDVKTEDVSIEIIGNEEAEDDAVSGFSGNIGSIDDSFNEEFEKDLGSNIWDNLYDEFDLNNLDTENDTTKDDALELTEKIYRGD